MLCSIFQNYFTLFAVEAKKYCVYRNQDGTNECTSFVWLTLMKSLVGDMSHQSEPSRR